jgi:nitronate monooxygenase
MKTAVHPQIIQGGMGIAVSGWKLAKAVSKRGYIGVVSGTAINSVLARRLQDGDLTGDMRRAMKAFPNQAVADKVLKTYFIEGGKKADVPYLRAPLFSVNSPLALLQLTVVSSFVEVWLAKEGHDGLVGCNLLEKVHLPNLPCLYGAMLADVDYVIMGAGIPREIPGVLDLFAKHSKAGIKIPVAGALPGEETISYFDPAVVMEGKPAGELKRPFFFPIVSSSVLAASLMKKSTGKVDGFIVESPLAGGHNAPPRGPMKLNDLGEPIYGERDVVSLAEMKALGLPFYMAGYYSSPEKIKEILAQGAHGVQAGTLFAFTEESGLAAEYKHKVINKIIADEHPENGWIYTDAHSSPTGFPFKAVRLEGTNSEKAIYEQRRRICDLGYLRHAYRKPDGGVGQRCSAEPVADFVKKGGTEEDTQGRKCLCNALMEDIGLGQTQTWGDKEKPLLTAGDDLNNLGRILRPGQTTYTADEVLNYLEQGFAHLANSQKATPELRPT